MLPFAIFEGPGKLFSSVLEKLLDRMGYICHYIVKQASNQRRLDMPTSTKQISLRLNANVVDYIKEVSVEHGIAQREVVELCVLACSRLGLFETLEGSGLGSGDYENLVRTACDSHMADLLYDYMKDTVEFYRGRLWG